MSIFPSLNSDLQAQINNVTSTSTTTSSSIGDSFKFDFDAGDFITKDGKLIKATEYEAIKIWIDKILKTEKFKFEIYKKTNTTMEYGITLMDLIISENYPLTYVKAEIAREITEALLKNNLIKSVDSFVFNRNKLILSVAFNVNLVDGTIIESGV